MNTGKHVSPRARALVEGFQSICSSILLIGQQGIPMVKDANYIASFLLETEEDRLSMHPDYVFYTRKEGERTIGVEVSDEIVARSLLLPAVAKRIVIVIDEINTMTVQAQNKLLKLLEECEGVIVIAVAYEDTLLATVKSRMQVVHYKPLSFEEYRSYAEGKDPYVLYYATGGIPDVTADSDIVLVFTEVKKALCSKTPHLALDAFHMVREKDENAFFTKHRAYVSSAIAFMGAVLCNLYEKDPENRCYGEALTLLSEHRNNCNTLSYTKDSFFLCVAKVVEILGKRKEEPSCLSITRKGP